MTAWWEFPATGRAGLESRVKNPTGTTPALPKAVWKDEKWGWSDQSKQNVSGCFMSVHCKSRRANLQGKEEVDRPINNLRTFRHFVEWSPW